jgi:hypothetical protein
MDLTIEHAYDITRAEMTPPSPVQARWFMGRKKPSDFIGTTLASPMLVSERVVTVLREEGFTGWRTYAVDLAGHDGAPIPGYHGFTVYGRCGPIDDTKSVEMPTVLPGGIFPRWYGLYFDPDTWDGSDLFISESYGTAIFVVEDIKQAFHKAKVRNTEFTSIVDVSRSQVEMEISKERAARFRETT